MEQIIALYKSTENRLSSPIVIDLIVRATSNKKIFGYAELYEPMRQRQPELKLSGKATRWIDILQIFTYGTWANYQEFVSDSMDEGDLPVLNEAQTTKLKQLTLLTLCAQSDVIPYATIQEALELGSAVDEVEGLVIETIYSGQLTAKLDARNKTVEVGQVNGRDVDAARVEEICNILNQFEERTDVAVSLTQQQIEEAKSAKTVRTLELEKYNQSVAKRLSTPMPKGPGLDSKGLKKRNRA